MAEQLEVAVELTNKKVQFNGISMSNPDRPITFDYKPPIGDGQGYTGLELLLMSFAGCSGTAVVYLLRKMGKDISGFNVRAKGTKRDQPPLTFQKIFLEFITLISRLISGIKPCGWVQLQSTDRSASPSLL